MTATRSPATGGYKWVGTRPVRHDGVDKVVGRARFAADLDLPGMLHGHVLRSPHVHARIVSINTSTAEAMPGVKAVITGADFPPMARGTGDRYEPGNVIARDRVLYEGHPIAAVAAGTRRQAEQAAAAIRVDYEVLPPVLSLERAMAPDAPVIHDDLFTKGVDPPPTEASNVGERTVFERGDLEAGFAEADVVVEREFTTKVVHQGYIEPHAVVADTTQDGRSTVWGSSQGHFMVRRSSAQVLGWEQSRIQVIPAEIGGGFGGKTTIYLEPLAIRLSEKASRPVKMVMSRDEVFRATGPTPATRIRVMLGARRDGTLTAGQAWMAYESGCYPGPWANLGCLCVLACWDIPNFLIEGFEVVVNKPYNAAYRAPSAPMAAFATETVLDEIARELDMDPIDLRLLNAVEEGALQPEGIPWPVIGLKQTLEAIRDHPHYRAPLGPDQGRGVASGYWMNIGESSSATVNLNENGTATVLTGSPDIGGSRASMALMAAEELGIDVYSIHPVVADTDAVGFTDITEGSRATFATGMAVVEACRDLQSQLCGRAARMWGVDVDRVEWSDGHARDTAGDHEPLALAAITAEAKQTGGPLTATGSLEARGAGPAFATQVCDVEVDAETGAVRVVRFTTAQDAGTAIHPSYVEGQMQGGAVQGIGWALNEEYIRDDHGVMQNASFLDYRMPVASDLPMIDTVIVEVPNPRHPYGVRGVGEVGIVPPIAAVANAIHDATGARLRDLPMSPPAVLAALDELDPDSGS